MATQGKRTKRARGRGSSNPPKPSTSLGVKIDTTRIQKKGPVKGFDAVNNKQKSAPFNSEQNDEDNSYNDHEDEEMQLIMDEIYQRQLVKKQAADANNAKKYIEASFGLSNSMRPPSRGSHVETDRRKVIPLEGISSSSGRRITRSQGRGCSNPSGPSPLCIDPPPQPGHTSVSPGVKNDKNRIQKKRRGKGIDTLNNQQKSTAFGSEHNEEQCDNNDGEDEELQLIIDKICQSQLHKQQATNAVNVEKYIGSNFGLSDNARLSSVGYHVESDTRKVISVEGISNPEIRGRGIRRGQGRGHSDAPGPSQSYIDPPPPAHTLVSPGVQNDDNIVQRKGLVKGIDALNSKQKATAINCEQSEEYNAYSDGEEDEEMQLIKKIFQRQLLKQQAAIANNVKKCIGDNFGLSNNVRPSSGQPYIEADMRKVVSVDGISNPGRGIKRGRGRGRSDPPAAHTSVSPGI
ncbi:hypothetical protein P8452_42461 [Trifolium repens]|nr:hypothetical protein P8452_42461 [Trifolium repens]